MLELQRLEIKIVSLIEDSLYMINFSWQTSTILLVLWEMVNVWTYYSRNGI